MMRAILFASLTVMLSSGCRRDMYNQPRYKTFAADPSFPDGAAARPLPLNTVPRGGANLDTEYSTGLTDDCKLLEAFPMPVTRTLLDRGRERYDIFCSVCHGHTGEGNGMIIQRGFPTPPSYHTDRLRNAPAGYLYYVITNGYGVMYPYASRVAPEDRWAIAAYIRALQLSHHATVDDIPAPQRTSMPKQ